MDERQGASGPERVAETKRAEQPAEATSRPVHVAWLVLVGFLAASTLGGSFLYPIEQHALGEAARTPPLLSAWLFSTLYLYLRWKGRTPSRGCLMAIFFGLCATLLSTVLGIAVLTYMHTSNG
jgi:hypothetical protein